MEEFPRVDEEEVLIAMKELEVSTQVSVVLVCSSSDSIDFVRLNRKRTLFSSSMPN